MNCLPNRPTAAQTRRRGELRFGNPRSNRATARAAESVAMNGAAPLARLAGLCTLGDARGQRLMIQGRYNGAP
jgi:hypothetical protein